MCAVGDGWREQWTEGAGKGPKRQSRHRDLADGDPLKVAEGG